jgi:hypothetical protein
LFHFTYFVVGYAQNGLQNGATLVAPQFLDVGEAGFSLDSFTPTGTELSDNISIMQIDEFGGEVATYVWIEWGGDNGDEKCWSLDGAGEKTEGVTFAPGEGLWVQGSSTSQYLTIPAPTL